MSATNLSATGGDVTTDQQLVSTAVPGMAPLAVGSATMVNNLNAQYLGGMDFAAMLRYEATYDPSFQISVVHDSVDNVGRFASLAIGADGLPVIAYRDGTAEAVNVVHCGDQTCTP